ncbi:hypothetical protein [Dactylosporangium matsuzakiense]|uniref:Sigma E regulatory protein, MucB/RseB n=1 Tax=Dactylosporangium matsuzakiense TaxID=53360 RepID=A0A9W6KRP9_9ACTN|nr:hypothetical protein [Dactylosporangium matsuzakiense]UWZ48568.1 hypothetical protein Dmats_20470 [Dactylosporangium matsuzakiense]GLL06398.1 hypothetical protein GCM10017581_081480 [Dactylosporangium matsuzakiense]
MSVVRREARRRWSAVAGLVGVLVAVPLVVAFAPVRAAAVTRDQVLAASDRPYQGYVETRGSVVLPDLPQLGELVGLFGGTTSMRVWHRNTDTWRVAVLDPVGERDTFRTPAATFGWDYGRNLWTETVGDPAVRAPRAADLTPPELARRLLRDAGADAEVRALAPRRVAGIAASGLRVVPKDRDSTIGAIDVWADPRSGLPLLVDVPGAFTTRFLDVSADAPADDVLQPRAAASSGFASSTQSEITSALNSVARANLPGDLAGRARVPGPVSAIAAYGSGLSRFVVIAVPGRLGQRTLNALRDGGGAPITQGYLIRAGVLSIAVTQAGRRTYLIAGFVTPALLTAAAGQLR